MPSLRFMNRCFVLFLLFTALVSCETEKRISAPQLVSSPRVEFLPELDVPIWDRRFGTMDSLSGDVIVSFVEGHPYYSDTGDPVFFMRQKTRFVYPNYNNSIDYDVDVSPGEIEFSHKGVFFPDIHQTAFGPATSSSSFRMENGVYRILFEYRDMRDRYDVTIDDTLVRIVQLDSNYTQSTHQLFWRYRPQSFAVSCGTTTETAFLCQEFVDSLMASLSLTEFLYPDSGAIPFRRRSAGHYNDAKRRFFVYDKEEDFRLAHESLEKFTLSKIAGQKGIGISLESWRNQWARSWQFPGGR